MPSELKNLKVKLTWPDFQGTKPANDPFLAATKSSFAGKFFGVSLPQFDNVQGSFKLKDEVVITITFDKTKSWKDIDNLGNTEQGFLLDHEQGHYDLTALMARDVFIDIMQLKSKTWSAELTGRNEVVTLLNDAQAKLVKLQAAYESETQNGKWFQPTMGPPTKSSDQTKWEGFIKKALTSDRAPLVEAPDGASYKLKILDVVAAGGVTI
jgi:hypothetical protein